MSQPYYVALMSQKTTEIDDEYNSIEKFSIIECDQRTLEHLEGYRHCQLVSSYPTVIAGVVRFWECPSRDIAREVAKDALSYMKKLDTDQGLEWFSAGITGLISKYGL